MKELSIEEKAKRYDELKVTAQGLEHDGCFDKITLFDLFPELEESEDERIRKALMQNLKERFGTKGNMGEGLNMPDVLAWLEKQGAQKPTWSEEDIMRIDNLIAIIENRGYPDYVEYLEKLKDRVQPQQEWSNLDKTIIESIEALCDEKIESVVFQDVKEHVNDIKDWLKSLKYRIQPQPKQEWSEEDKKNSKNILYILNQLKGTAIYKEDKTAEICIDWFKSLKDRVGCEVNCTTMWKPSDEQIKVCKEVYADILSAKGFDLGTVNSELNRLEKQLKKIREE